MSIVEGDERDRDMACEKDIYEQLVAPGSDGQLTVVKPDNLSILEKDGRSVSNTETGSILFDIFCPTIESLDNLWELYTNGALLRHFNDVLHVEEIKEKHGAKDINLNLSMTEAIVEICRGEIMAALAGKIPDKMFIFLGAAFVALKSEEPGITI